MHPIGIKNCGMVTCVGHDAEATCAALRVGIDGFVDTRFMYDGDWLQGGMVKLEEKLAGKEKLIEMAVMAVVDCLSDHDFPADIPIIACLSELDRPGRFPDLGRKLVDEVRERVGLGRSDENQLPMVSSGRVGGVEAVMKAGQLISQGHKYCLIMGVDTYLSANTLDYYHQKRRLLTEKCQDGFIPGEAAAVVLLSGSRGPETGLSIFGAGLGKERSSIETDDPLRSDGLTQAIQAALVDGHCTYKDIHYRITDNNGEHYGFRDSTLALSRTMRVLKEQFEIWHPADCIGEVGAAIVPLTLGVAFIAAKKKYAPGTGVLCHYANDNGERAAVILKTAK